ncbi:MAG: TSUP family transporter, partial [Planctomycetota bacterium]
MTAPARPASRSIVAVALFVWACWLAGMVSGDRWGVFAEAWFMSITMVIGSFIAGATSEGGGAVAFPVMTLVFEIKPAVARDFSLMIQAVGMTAASATILYTRIPVERHALVWSSLGGAVGIVLGIEVIAPLLSPKFTKMTFLAVWLSFAFALFWINRYHDREVRT